MKRDNEIEVEDTIQVIQWGFKYEEASFNLLLLLIFNSGNFVLLCTITEDRYNINRLNIFANIYSIFCIFLIYFDFHETSANIPQHNLGQSVDYEQTFFIHLIEKFTSRYLFLFVIQFLPIFTLLIFAFEKLNFLALQFIIIRSVYHFILVSVLLIILFKMSTKKNLTDESEKTNLTIYYNFLIFFSCSSCTPSFVLCWNYTFYICAF